MIITFLKNESCYSFSLPEKVSGQYWITDEDSKGNQINVISIDGTDGVWKIRSNKRAYLLSDEGRYINNRVIENACLYPIFMEKDDDMALIYAESDEVGVRNFSKLVVRTDCEIGIGRSPSNAISINNPSISGEHAKLTLFEERWVLEDLGSKNGTFLNGKRVNSKQEVSYGDVVYMMGFKLIVGNRFIAINNPEGCVRYDRRLFLQYVPDKIEPIGEDAVVDDNDDEVEYYYRSPRFKRDIKEEEIRVDSPTSSELKEEMPLIYVVGPSMTMGMASMTTAIFSINNAMQNGNIAAAIPSIAMSASMLLGTVLWPILSKRYDKKRRRKKEFERQASYERYLGKLSDKFQAIANDQSDILHENYISAQECVELIKCMSTKLWEREIGQNDFLKLRIGLGEEKLAAKIHYQEKKFSMVEDKMLDKLYDLCEHPPKLKNVPITISLFQNYVSGIVGQRSEIIDFTKNLILQLATFYGYDEVKFVFLLKPEEIETFRFVKWLPHTWDNDKNIRYLATNTAELKEISSFIERELENRKAVSEKEAEYNPAYIIFNLNQNLGNKSELLRKIYELKSYAGFSIVNVVNRVYNLPKECTKVIELDNKQGKIYDKNDISGKHVEFKSDKKILEDFEELSVRLANVFLDLSDSTFNLPKMITFLEMYNVGKIEHLNAELRWKENDPTKSLEAPIGIDTSGDIFKLDLHEKFHGPHGLVAGMTGSGKSEFIMTYILSLALNYHPYEVAFILIDYKGGGMAKAFENLPHVAGIITNLDGAAVNRSLISIQSELKRRQAIFAATSKEINVSNIDIYKYQKLYREGRVTEPLQHLFIISDEFAELKTQQPEFMAQLISAARIGRSLGVHLILATQKPAGVVDDQIWSNSKFRICLKVQDRADSNDMLKRPDAAELVETGRFYLQVGYNELFELGQSAWAGAPYYPADRVLTEVDNNIEVIERTGHVIRQVKIDNKKQVANAGKQLDEITNYLKRIAEEDGIHVRPLWLEPISPYIYVDELERKYGYQKQDYLLNPVVGEYDDPTRQARHLLTLPLSTGGNTLVYGTTGNGKTTFVTAFMYSLIKNHTPEEVNLYVLDFSSETLRAFAKVPHVGDVLVAGDNEKIANLFKLLDARLKERKQQFADYGGDYWSYINSGAGTVPNIVVVVHNFMAFSEMYDDYDEILGYLTREGAKYGIYFVLTANSTNAVRYKLQQNFSQTFVMQMNDVSEYAAILGNVGGIYPSKHKGRGIVKLDEIYEYQTASIVSKEHNVFEFIRNYAEQLQGYYGTRVAMPIPVLPERLDSEYMKQYPISLNSIPVAIDKKSLELIKIDLSDKYAYVISGQERESIGSLGQAIAELLSEITNVSVLDVNCEFTEDDERTYEYITGDFEEYIEAMFNMLVYRNNTYKANGMQINPDDDFEHRVYIINNMTDLMEELSEDCVDKLKVLLEKGQAYYNVNIIICEDSTALPNRTREPWYKTHCSVTNAVWIGNGLGEQYAMKVSATPSQLRKDVEDGFGYVIEKGKCTMAKIMITRMQEEDEENEQ